MRNLLFAALALLATSPAWGQAWHVQYPTQRTQGAFDGTERILAQWAPYADNTDMGWMPLSDFLDLGFHTGTLAVANGGTGAASLTNLIGPTELQSTAVTPGSYTLSNVTVDADGRITAISSGAGGGSGDILAGEYGGLSLEDNATTTTFAGTSTDFSQKSQVTVFDTNAPGSSNTTADHTNDHVTIGVSGPYIVAANVSFSGGSTDTYSFATFINNGATQIGPRFTRKLGTGGDVGSASVAIVYNLTAGDTVELWCQNEDDTTELTVEDASLKVFSVPGFDPMLVEGTTWGDGSEASFTWTYDVIGTNPTIVFGAGSIALGNYLFDIDQSLGAGQDNYVLTYDNATGTIQLEANSAAASLGSNFSSTTDDLRSDSGQITLSGTGNTNDEELTFDFESTANVIGISSGTGVVLIDWGSIGFSIGSLDVAGALTVQTAVWDDGADTVQLDLDGDRIYHDTDADGTKDAGENYIDAAPLEYDYIWIDAGAMVPQTTSGAAADTNEYATEDIMSDRLLFDGASAEHAQWKLVLPPHWDEGTVKVKVYWDADTGASAADTVEWEVQAAARGNDEAIDDTWGTAVTINDAVVAVGDVHITSASAAMTIGNTPAEGDLIWFKINRDPAGTDDMTEDAALLGVMIEFAIDNTSNTGW